jgi:hypothetical protein
MENVFLQQELAHRAHTTTDSHAYHILHAQMEEHGAAQPCNAHALKILFGTVKVVSLVVLDKYTLII